MFIHDLVKIRLSRLGYLPDYPPHLISDAEMCDGFFPYKYDPDNPESGYYDFMHTKINYFTYNFPLLDDSLSDAYKNLILEIAYHIHNLKISTETDYELPNWVYSYMLGFVISDTSEQKDKHDLFVLLGTDNLYDEFDAKSSIACYNESVRWLTKLTLEQRKHRPPTMFGEPHVIKSLRLKALNS